MPRLFILTFIIALPLLSFAQALEDQKCGHQYANQLQEINGVQFLAAKVDLDANGIKNLAFGLKAGMHVLDVDFTKLDVFDQNDPRFQNNIDNKFQPQIGAGLYFHTPNYYVGLSVPNFLTTRHFDVSSLDNSNSESTPQENVHYFLIAGYVFDEPTHYFLD